MMKRRIAVTSCAVLLSTALASPANADPTNARTSALIDTLCDSQPLTMVVNGNGVWSPAHVIDSTSVFIPTALDLTLTFTPAGGGQPLLDHAILGKAAPIQNTLSCTIPPQTLSTGPEGTRTITGTLTGFLTPR